MRKFIIKSTLFLALIYLAQFIIVQFFPYRIPVDAEKMKENNADIIFFGDSSVLFYSLYDKDKRSTAKILGELVEKKHRVEELANASWNATVFANYSRYLLQQHFAPKIVIVPINLRSFSVEWDLRPMFQFSNDENYFRYYNTFLYPFLGFISNLSMADVNQHYENLYRDSLVYDGNIPLGRAADFEDLPETMPYAIRFRKIITFFYFSAIRPNHRKLQSLLEITDIYKNTNTKVIFYVTPVDYQTGEKNFGTKFKKRISDNVNIINSELRKTGATVIDLSLVVPTKEFTWSENRGLYVNEHLNYTGRFFIASYLAKVINSLEKK